MRLLDCTIFISEKAMYAQRKRLGEDVERLETKVLFANIALMPIVVALFAVLLAVWRVRRRSRRAVEA